MEDFSKDIIEGKSVSPKMRELLNKEKAEARKRIVERGIVHFRADEQFMEALLSAAEEQKIAPGTLCRNIVWKCLNSQAASVEPVNLPEPYTLTVNEHREVYGAPSVDDFAKLVAEISEIKQLLLPKSTTQQPAKSQERKKGKFPIP